MPSVIDNCTKWTTFAVDAEVEHYGTMRLCKSHNEVLDEARVLRTENEQLRELLTPCRPDTDAQTDAAYPKTANDVLHLLSCYWADFLPDDMELGDEYYAAWERQARPLIERLRAENEQLKRMLGRE